MKIDWDFSKEAWVMQGVRVLYFLWGATAVIFAYAYNFEGWQAKAVVWAFGMTLPLRFLKVNNERL